MKSGPLLPNLSQKEMAYVFLRHGVVGSKWWSLCLVMLPVLFDGG